MPKAELQAELIAPEAQLQAEHEEEDEERHGPYEGRQRILYGIGGGDAKLVFTSYSGFAEHETDRLELTHGGMLMLGAQALAAAVLIVMSTTNAVEFVGRAPFAPPRNATAEIAEAQLAGHPYSTAEIAAMEEDGFSWTYFRLWWFVLSLVLSLFHRCLLLDAARRDPVAIANRDPNSSGALPNAQVANAQVVNAPATDTHDELWGPHAKDDIEIFAKLLFQWLWVPTSLAGLILFGVALLSGTAASIDWALYALTYNLVPIINTAATTLVLGSQCVTVHKFAENLLVPYGIDPDPYGGSAPAYGPGKNYGAQAQQAQQQQALDPEELLARFRGLARELEILSRGWKYVLGIQACYFCAQLGSTTTTVYRRHGYQNSLITGQTLESNQAFFYLAQTLPVVWALWLSFGTIIHLNTYLANIPDRVSRSCCAEQFGYIGRAAFAAEYQRLGVHLDVPYIGEITSSSRLSALASFAGVLIAAQEFAPQLKDTLGA